MPAIPQELIVAILIGGVIVFYLFVIFSGRKKKDKGPEKEKKQ